MIISVLGLGYVGTTISLCLANDGHTVNGFDLSLDKVAQLNSNKLHIFEPDLEEILKKVNQSNFHAYTNINSEFTKADIIIICIGTPTKESGEVDLTQLSSVITELSNLKEELGDKAIILRSTVPPGTTQNYLFKLFDSDNIFYIPEFLREGSAIKDFYTSQCIIGTESTDKENINRLSILPNFQNKKVVSIKAAEYLKYVNNSFHALKVSFANEIGSIANALNIDSQQVFDSFLDDTHLNISTAYLKPGFSFGGSCLIKDVKALNYLSSHAQIKSRTLSSLLDSNNDHTSRFIDLITSQKKSNVIFMGASFKPNTDDQRFSPTLTIIDQLLQLPSYKVFKNISIYDSEVARTKIVERYNTKVSFISKLEDQLNDDTLIVWGSLSPDKQCFSELKKYNLDVINLGHFDSSLFKNVFSSIRSVI